jgi:hypothetical protein
MHTCTRADTTTSAPQCSQGHSTRSLTSLHIMQPSVAQLRSMHQ